MHMVFTVMENASVDSPSLSLYVCVRVCECFRFLGDAYIDIYHVHIEKTW